MALDLGTVVATVDLNSTSFVQSADRARQAADNLEGAGAGAMRQAESRLDAFGAKLDAISASLIGFGTKMTAAVTLPLIGLGVGIFNQAASWEQAIGKTQAVYGDASSDIIQWSEDSATAYGMSQTEALNMVGTYGQIMQAQGMAVDTSSEYSKNLIGLAADMSAFSDVSQDRTTLALQSALTGEYESMKQFGVVLKADAVEQEALNIAIAQGREEVTEADRVQARYNLIMEQTTQMQGQFAREADGASGMMSIFKAQVKDTAANFGRLLLPAGTKALRWVSDFLRKIDDLTDTQKRWVLGIAAAAAAIGPLAIGLGWVLRLFTPLLTVIGALLSPIGLLAVGLGALAYIFRDDIADAVETVVTWFTDFVTESENVQAMVGNLVSAFNAFKDGDYGEMFTQIGEAAGNLWAAIQEAVSQIDWAAVGQTLLSGLTSLAGFVAGFVLNLGNIAVSVAGWLWNQAVDLWTGLKTWAIGLVPAGEDINLGTIAAAIAGWAFSAVTGLWDALTGWAIGGIQGDGTGGPTSSTGQITLGTVLVNVLSWGRGALGDLFGKVQGWAQSAITNGGRIALEVLAFTWDLALGKPTVLLGFDIDRVIEDAIGTVVYHALDVALDLVDAVIDNPGDFLETVAKVIGVALLGLAAIQVGIALAPFLLPLALLIGLGVLAVLAFNAIVDYFVRNPLKAVELALKFKAVWDGVMEGVHDLGVRVTRKIQDALGLDENGYLRISVGLAFDFFEGNGEDPIEGGGDLLGTDKETGVPPDAVRSGAQGAVGATMPGMSLGVRNMLWTGGGGGGREEMGQSLKPLLAIFSQLRTEAASTGASMQSFQGTTSASLTAVKGSADTNLVPIPPTVAAMAGGITGAALPAFQTLASAALTRFGMVRQSASTETALAAGAATSNTGILATGVTANMAAMAANARAQATSANTGVSAQMLGMQTASTARALTMATLVGAHAGTMASNAITQASSMNRSVAMQATGMQSATVAKASAMALMVAFHAGSMANQAGQQASSMASRMTSGAARAASGVAGALARVPGIVAGIGGAAAATAYSVGANIGFSMASGMRGALGAISAAANAMVAEADRAVRARARIASPSRLFAGLGAYIGEGFEQGIRSMIPDVARATAALVTTPSLPAYGNDGPAPAAFAGARATTTTTITYGDIHITQQPGEDGEALAHRIVGIISASYDDAAAGRA